jgi:hypothetical protein
LCTWFWERPAPVATNAAVSTYCASPVHAGAWPPSALDASGQYVYDHSDGKILSRFTALLYLNDDFDGGWTTFFTPSPDLGVMNAFPIKPRAGSLLIFPHGDVTALLHEGSPVLAGVKYVVRTEIEFPFDGVRH